MTFLMFDLSLVVKQTIKELDELLFLISSTKSHHDEATVVSIETCEDNLIKLRCLYARISDTIDSLIEDRKKKDYELGFKSMCNLN